MQVLFLQSSVTKRRKKEGRKTCHSQNDLFSSGFTPVHRDPSPVSGIRCPKMCAYLKCQPTVSLQLVLLHNGAQRKTTGLRTQARKSFALNFFLPLLRGQTPGLKSFQHGSVWCNNPQTFKVTVGWSRHLVVLGCLWGARKGPGPSFSPRDQQQAARGPVWCNTVTSSP